jgi:hypothetical protein
MLVEGQSEEIFVKQTLAPHLAGHGVFVQPIVLWTKRLGAGGGYRGGVSNWNQIKRSLLPLTFDTDAWITTLLDFYGLPEDVPGYRDALLPGNPWERVMELIDNITRLLGDDLKATLKPKARLKIAASCFSMYAFEALKAELEKIDELSFIFTSPTFTASEVTDKIRKERKEFHIPKLDRERSLYGSEFEIQLRNKLTQRAIAKECADWMRRKARFKSNRTKAPMQQFACVQAAAAQTPPTCRCTASRPWTWATSKATPSPTSSTRWTSPPLPPPTSACSTRSGTTPRSWRT